MSVKEQEQNAVEPDEKKDAKPENPEAQAQGVPSTVEDPAEELLAEAENLCASLEKSFRRAFDIPTQTDLADLHGFQATIRDLVERALQSGAGAQDDLKKLTRERDHFKEAASRAKADFLNYQERAKRDLAGAEESVLRGYVMDLLPILDSLELALADARKEGSDPENIKAAVEMMATALEQTLKVRGLVRIEANGKDFDPNHHEAITTRPVDESKGERPNLA